MYSVYTNSSIDKYLNTLSDYTSKMKEILQY